MTLTVYPRKDGRFSMLKSDPTVRPYSRCTAASCILLTVHATVCVVPCGWLVLQVYFIDYTSLQTVVFIVAVKVVVKHESEVLGVPTSPPTQN